MLVPDEVRKCVVFIGYRLASGHMRLAGTAFFLGPDSGGHASQVFLVTARHVIDQIRKLGLDEVFVRLNMANGESVWAQCQSSGWLFHPSDASADVAILEAGIPIEADHLVYPLSRAVTDAVLKEEEIGLGEEVFVVGLFRHHHGERRNIPIVRVGNLAAMAEEKIQTKAFGLMDAYLVEARSIGGLSGSPVFLNLGSIRSIRNQMRYSTGGPIYYLLGLVHGHFDVSSAEIDNATEDSGLADRVNTGIAIVVPMHKIRETMEAHASKAG